MKKALCSFLAVVFLLPNLSLLALAAKSTTPESKVPSDLFISLYTEVFLQTDTYEVFTRNGDRISTLH